MAVLPTTDTIAAIATAPGRGGIGIVRISGPQALSLLRTLFVPSKPRVEFTSHTLYHGKIVAPNGPVLDEVLAVYMRAPRTYTREDVVEIHCHGSFLVQSTILSAILECGARPAEGGEFTKRAFLSGRIDLTRAEAVLDLLQAETVRGHQLAVNQLEGKLFLQMEEIRHELIAILAVLEVAIDFPDDDVEIFNHHQVQQQLTESVIGPVVQLMAMAEQGRIFREGIRVVIFGRPNVGKSSLLNALLREERALVTPLPGTTRDTIEEVLSVRGIPVHLVDTAGIRAHEDPIEALGIERAQQKLREADVVLFLLDAEAGVSERDRELYATICGKQHLVVANKEDLISGEQLALLQEAFPGRGVIPISARDGSGLETLQDELYRLVIGDRLELADQLTFAPNIRHRSVLSKTLEACRHFEQSLVAGVPVDLLAVDIQSALDYLGDITGVTTAEDVLDTIFTRFCIGK